MTLLNVFFMQCAFGRWLRGGDRGCFFSALLYSLHAWFATSALHPKLHAIMLLFGTFRQVAGIIELRRRILDRAGLTADNTSYLLVAARPNAHFYFFVI
jgi:hypothetical protein